MGEDRSLIEVASTFSQDFQGVLDELQKLPQAIRPAYFGDSENKLNERNIVSDSQLFERFLRRNTSGFFLFGNDGCRLYDIKISPREECFELYLDMSEDIEDNILPFFETIVWANPEFAYAADLNERKHRNRCCKIIGMNRISDWVGRDIRKYVPGLYYCTLFSERLIRMHDIDFARLASAALSHDELRSGEYHLLRFFGNAAAWKANAATLDDLCDCTDGIFSIQTVLCSVADINNLIDYDEVISRWP